MAPRKAQLLVSGLLLATVALSACGILAPWSETVSVSDPINNQFHFKIPSVWQSSTENGFISLYAGKELPAEDDESSELSVLVFSSRETSSASTAEMLDYLVDSRADSRGWTGVKKDKVELGTVGKRPASVMHVTAKNADGAPFDSRYYFVRTSSGETFIAAIAPNGKNVSDFAEDLQQITTQWYWHSSESTGTPQSESATSGP